MTVTTSDLGGGGDAPTPSQTFDGTTRVVMLVSITGTRNGEDWPARGGTIDLDAAEAADLVNGGLAIVAEEQPEAPKKRPAKKAAAPSDDA